MMVPGSAYIIINNYIPMTGIVVAFKQYNTRLGLYNSPNICLLYTSIFQCLRDNSDLCTVTLGDYGDKRFAAKLINIGRERCVDTSLKYFKGASPKQIEYFYAFVSAGCIGLLRKWLDDGMTLSLIHISSFAPQYCEKNSMPPPTKPQYPENISDENWAQRPTAPTDVSPSGAIIIVSTMLPVVVRRFCSATGMAITARFRRKFPQENPDFVFNTLSPFPSNFRVSIAQVLSLIHICYMVVQERDGRYSGFGGNSSYYSGISEWN